MVLYGENIRLLGAIPLIPGNDLISCLISGELTYEDVIDSSMGLLDSADAMFLVPGWEDSKGVQGEIEYAKAHNIPVCGCIDALKMFLRRPKILCIIGESGSGKSLMADYIEDKYKIPMIRSYTDRPQRDEDDNGHTFITKEEFDEISFDEMIAYTEWNGTRYCCIHEDVWVVNTYVIDESGYSMLKTKYSQYYNVRGVRVHRDKNLREDCVGEERVTRDMDKFNLYAGDFDFHIDNNGKKEDFYNGIDTIVDHFFQGDM